MTTIAFYGGVNEIGGNKILIEDKTKIFLDFGKNFSREKQYFEEPLLKPEKSRIYLNWASFHHACKVYMRKKKAPVTLVVYL